MIHSDTVEHGGEFVAVLGIVNALGGCSENVDVLGIETQGEIVRYLSAGGNNDSVRILQFKDIHHAFECQFVKVKPVTHIIVGRYGFGIIVDHHRTPSFLTDRIKRLHPAPVELHGRTDPVGTRTENDDGTMVTQVSDVVGCAAIGQVKIIGLCRIFGSQRIDLLHHGNNAQALTVIADIKAAVFHIAFVADGTCNLEVGESLTLGLLEQVGRQVGYLLVIVPPLMEFLRSIHDIHQFLEEPLVDLSQFVHLIDGISGTESLRDDKDTFIGRFVQCFVDVGDNEFLVFHKTMHPLSDHSQALLNRFLKSAANGHYLTDGLHRRAEFLVHTVELTEVPTRNFADYIIECRLKEGTGGFRHRVLQVEQPVAKSEFCSHKGKRITGSLGSQGRRTAQAGIHLDHAIVFTFGVESILHVTFSHNADVADDADGELAQFMILLIGQGL